MITYDRKLQSGRSMIEMLGVLAIVGVLSAGGIAGYSMAMQSHKTSELMSKVNLIAQQTRSMYDDAVYKEDTTDATLGNIGGRLVAGGFMPDLESPFGGPLKVSPSTLGDVFTIETLDNVPRESCVKILLTDWGTNGTIKSISVDGAAVTSFPADPDTASDTCNDNNLMIWTIN